VDLETYDELSVVSAMQFGRVVIDGDQQFLGAVDPSTINQVFALQPNGDAVSALSQPGSMIVASGFLEKNGWKVGDIVTTEFAHSGEVEMSVVGTFEADEFSNIYVSTETFKANYQYVGDGLVFANARDGVGVAAAQEAISPTVDAFGNVKAQTKSEIVDELETQIDQALALFTGLLLFAVIIAILGITNTLTLSIYERTREIWCDAK